MNLHPSLVAVLAITTPARALGVPERAAAAPVSTGCQAQTPPPVPSPPQTPALEGNMNGTRGDLALFLRRHRRALRLRFFDRWGDADFPIHSFVSLLERTPFRDSDGSRSCAMHFTIFPF